MKNLIICGIIFLASFILISCDKKEKVTSNNDVTQVEVQQKDIIPTVTWQLGIGIDLWRAKYDCLRGFGVCRINAVFVQFAWDNTTHHTQINFGVSDHNTIIIEFENSIDIGSYGGQNYIEIESGDEDITIDSAVITYFSNQNIDISNLSLVQGTYYFQYDNSTNNYYIEIPYTN